MQYCQCWKLHQFLVQLVASLSKKNKMRSKKNLDCLLFSWYPSNDKLDDDVALLNSVLDRRSNVAFNFRSNHALSFHYRSKNWLLSKHWLTNRNSFELWYLDQPNNRSLSTVLLSLSPVQTFLRTLLERKDKWRRNKSKLELIKCSHKNWLIVMRSSIFHFFY